VILFLVVESCIPKDVLRVWLRNTGTLLRDDNGSSTFGDRMKDLLSSLCIRLKEKKEIPY